ncbi:hypothetical protein ADUPG1_008213 [Aduncisulcus paluster]|uniref:Uncharacterized protein n=1 Tax=Aduncisulcus paluster TaxID=2918883 RepID=A0ABQ5KR48_9EUKA|nr:hypothetical protein ADUPG1_008213 [Aduncisulcus paluster]
MIPRTPIAKANASSVQSLVKMVKSMVQQTNEVQVGQMPIKHHLRDFEKEEEEPPPEKELLRKDLETPDDTVTLPPSLFHPDPPQTHFIILLHQ